MKDQTMIFLCVASIFFGKESLLVDYLKGFYTAMVRYASELKYKCREDNLLPAKILLAADQELQRWLKECRAAKHREDVNDDLLDNLKNIVNDAVRGRFFIVLPKAFKVEESGPKEGPAKHSSKKRKVSEERGIVVKNNSPNEAYKLRDGEVFRDMFGGKNLEHMIEWNRNSKMCPRFHSKFYCFKDCKNKESRVPKSEVSATMDAKYKRFLKKCRSE